jgi:glycosyltransferase involved in cell wall biosynthesis
MVEISVLICTYNRSSYLSGAIDSCLQQTIDDGSYEIVVIDNNSSDSTSDLLKRYQQQHKNVRHIVEDRQGLNFARTRGAHEAKGKYIAYLDDDARADQSWLKSLLEAFADRSPTPVCVGGRVYLDWENHRPTWYPTEYESLMAYVDHGDNGFYLARNNSEHYLIGTNMAFERRVVLDLGGFRTEYGRKHRRTISGAETEMINRLVQKGFPVYYEPKAVVTHVVVPERRTKRFLIDRVQGDGATQPLLDLDNRAFCNTNLLKRIAYDAKSCVLHLTRSGLLLARGRSEDAFIAFLDGVQRWGRTAMELKFLYDREFAPLWRHRWERFQEPYHPGGQG